MLAKPLILLACLLGGTPAWAHRPYDRPAGSFTRNDGVSISITEHYVDGIILADPVSVQFRTQEGTLIAETDSSPDHVVLRTMPGRVRIYRFETDWFPVARTVHQFDGYSLSDISTARLVLLSPFVHTRAHLQEYAAALTFGGLLLAGWWFLRSIPKRGWLRGVWVCGAGVLGLATALYALSVVAAAPLSPIVLVLMGACCAVPVLLLRRHWRHHRGAG